MRNHFDDRGMHRLEFGSHLVVCGSSPNGLWDLRRQRDLLHQFGCTVQCTVIFEEEALEPMSQVTAAMRAIGARHPMFFTFEAAVDGSSIVQTGSSAEGSKSSTLNDSGHFRVVDINGLTEEAYFWAAAENVGPAWLGRA